MLKAKEDYQSVKMLLSESCLYEDPSINLQFSVILVRLILMDEINSYKYIYIDYKYK